MFQTKVVEKSKHTFYVLQLFLKLMPFMRYVEKYCRAGQASDKNTAHVRGMLDTKGNKHMLRICNTYCFSTATVVA
jgi:hypothetical protein